MRLPKLVSSSSTYMQQWRTSRFLSSLQFLSLNLIFLDPISSLSKCNKQWTCNDRSLALLDIIFHFWNHNGSTCLAYCSYWSLQQLMHRPQLSLSNTTTAVVSRNQCHILRNVLGHEAFLSIVVPQPYTLVKFSLTRQFWMKFSLASDVGPSEALGIIWVGPQVGPLHQLGLISLSLGCGLMALYICNCET